MVAPSRPTRRHFGSGPARLADVVQPRAVAAAPAIRVPLDLIDPSPRNPRRALDVDELVASIRAYGLLQPVILRRVGARYELVAGHRRHAALTRLAAQEPDDPRWREVEAVVRQADQDEAYLLTLAENLQRTDLSPREEAAALEVLVRQEGWSVRRVAEAIHRDPMHVSRRLRVFDDPVLAAPVLAGALPVSTAEVLLRVDQADRAGFVARAISEGWTQATARKRLGQGRRVTLRPGPALVGHLRAAVGVLEHGEPAYVEETDRTAARRLIRRLNHLLRESVDDD
jgi:ParB family transcriptional regulator, chromosome partitioning protein